MIKSANKAALEMALRTQMEKQAFGWDDIVNGGRGAINELGNAVSDIWEGGKETVSGIGRSAYNLLTGPAKAVGGVAGRVAAGGAQMVGARDTADAISDWSDNQFRGVAEDAGDWAEGVRETGRGLLRGASGAVRTSAAPWTMAYGGLKGMVEGAEARGRQQAQQSNQPAPAPATPAPAPAAPAPAPAPAAPAPAPRSDASATAQQGNDMMRGGRPNRASMNGVEPVPVPAPAPAPVFDPSKITRNDMRKYRRYTAANDMNSEMDKWKTWMAMQGHRNASNADYRRAKANGFRM